MRVKGLILGFSVLTTTTAAIGSTSTYSVQPTPGAKFGTVGIYAVEIYKENEQWRLLNVRSGVAVLDDKSQDSYNQKLANKPLEKEITGEILLIDPLRKVIFLGANPPDPRNESAGEHNSSADKTKSFECFYGLGSTSRRSQGYNVCSSNLTKVKINPIRALFTNIFNVIFGTVSVRKEVDPKVILLAANQSGALVAVEQESEKLYQLIKQEAKSIQVNNTGRMRAGYIDYFTAVYKDRADKENLANFIYEQNRMADAAQAAARDARNKIERLEKYRANYQKLSDTAVNTSDHQKFLATFNDYDPDNVHAIVLKQIDNIDARIRQDLKIVGNRICKYMDQYMMIGYIEAISAEKFQIRMADIQQSVMGRSWSVDNIEYNGIRLGSSAIFWDNYYGWYKC